MTKTRRTIKRLKSKTKSRPRLKNRTRLRIDFMIGNNWNIIKN